MPQVFCFQRSHITEDYELALQRKHRMSTWTFKKEKNESKGINFMKFKTMALISRLGGKAGLE